MNKKKIISDLILNIGATAAPIIVLQLVILPALADDMSDDRYGLLVTILSLLNVIPATLGNVLNNIRLLYNDSYKESECEGDFNIILLFMAAMNIIIVGIASFYYDHSITWADLLLTILVSVFWLAKEYFIVSFLIEINYAAILLNNLLQVVGYIVGYLIYCFTGYWQIIYIMGYIVSLIYIFKRSSLWREKLKITALFKNTISQGTLLMAASVLARITTYADKMLIYPIVGGAMVSVYYTATLSGKIVSMAITPVNGVILTYLSKRKKKTDDIFWSAFWLGIGVCIVGYIFCLIISRPVLNMLYPQYADEAMKYILVTTGTSVLYALTAIVSPFVMKFFDMKWQVAISGGTAIIYVVLCMVLLFFWGMYGFCLGAFFTNLFKLMFMLFIYVKCKPLKAEMACK